MLVILPKYTGPTIPQIMGRSLIWVFNLFALALIIFACGWFQLAYLLAPYAIIGLTGAGLFVIYRYLRVKEKFEYAKFIVIPLIIFVAVLLLGKFVILKHCPSLMSSSSSEEDVYEPSEHYQGAMD